MRRRQFQNIREPSGLEGSDISVVPEILPSDNDLWDHQGARVNYPNVA